MKPLSNNRKYPPYAKALLDRQRFKNPPWLVAVCVGGDAWQSAKLRNQRGDSVALVLPAGDSPSAYTWPVSGYMVVIDWSLPAPVQLIVELVRSLMVAGAKVVVVWPRWIAANQPSVEYDATKQVGQRWVQVRESIRVYHPPRREVAHAA